jgi:hypothetical protein
MGGLAGLAIRSQSDQLSEYEEESDYRRVEKGNKTNEVGSRNNDTKSWLRMIKGKIAQGKKIGDMIYCLIFE